MSDDDKYVTHEELWRMVKHLVNMIITARKEAALAKIWAQLLPSTPEETRLQLLQQTEQGYEALRRKLDETPAPDVLQWLRDFEGSIQ